VPIADEQGEPALDAGQGATPPHADTEFAVQSIGTDLRQLGEANMRLHTGAAVLILLGVIFLLINLGIAPAAELKSCWRNGGRCSSSLSAWWR
jgi:hypothetical protein